MFALSSTSRFLDSGGFCTLLTGNILSNSVLSSSYALLHFKSGGILGGRGPLHKRFAFQTFSRSRSESSKKSFQCFSFAFLYALRHNCRAFFASSDTFPGGDRRHSLRKLR